MTVDGLIACVSKFGPKETMDRLAVAVTRRGISIMARIDQATAAAAVGMKLRPTEVFGNPQAGTPLMQAVQTIGIDLPLKALVWQDEGWDDLACLQRFAVAGAALRDRCRAGSDPSRNDRCPRRDGE